MNAVIKPFFDQLIEDREYTHSTELAPMQVVQDYIESLEELVQEAYGGIDVTIGKGSIVMN
jgi:hypothetical protein